MHHASRLVRAAAGVLLVATACSGSDRAEVATSTTPPPPVSTVAPLPTAPTPHGTLPFTRIDGDGMTLPNGPVLVRGAAVSPDGGWLIAGTEFLREADGDVPTVWRVSAGGDVIAERLPAAGGAAGGAAGTIGALAATDERVLVAGSSSDGGAAAPVVWIGDGGAWSAIALPGSPGEAALHIAASGNLIAVIGESVDGRPLWLSRDAGATWERHDSMALSDPFVTDVAVLGNTIVLSGYRDDSGYLRSTLDGETFIETELLGARVNALTATGTTVAAAGHLLTDAGAQAAAWVSADATDWTATTNFAAAAGGPATSGIVDITLDRAGFTAVSRTDVFASSDGIAWTSAGPSPEPARFVTAGRNGLLVAGGSSYAIGDALSWETFSLGPAPARAPTSRALGHVDGTIVLTGVRSPLAATPMWTSTEPGAWTLVDHAIDLVAFPRTGGGVALAREAGDVQLATLEGHREWSTAIIDADTPFFAPLGIQRLENRTVAYGGTFGAAASDGAVVVWDDTAAPGRFAAPDVFASPAGTTTEIAAVCPDRSDVWVGVGVRRPLDALDSATAELVAASTVDATTWLRLELPNLDATSVSVSGCIGAGDEGLVLWGTATGTSRMTVPFVFRSPDGGRWTDATPPGLPRGAAALTEIIWTGDHLLAFGSPGGRPGAWLVGDATWDVIDTPGLDRLADDVVVAGPRLVVRSSDPSRVAAYEADLSDLTVP